jgi:F-type H+-transporting ATPase subunit alpha
MVEVLKQPPYSPSPVEKQITIIFAGAKGYLDSIRVEDVVRFEAELNPFLEAKYPSILENIRSAKKIDNDTEAELKKALEDFLTVFNAD